MQTLFTDDQLQDPKIRRANQILRSCVHCGFCTATCPSYQVLGDELDSPRGRIYLIKDMLENDRPADARTVKHIDRCLSCLACMTTCPSGVHYMHLVDHAREHIEKTYRRPWHDRALRWLLTQILPYPGRFRLALLGAKVAKPFKRLLPGKLGAMVDLAPPVIAGPARHDEPQTHPAIGRTQVPRRPDDRLRAAGAEQRHQRGDDPAADPARLRRGDRRRHRLLRGADPSHGKDRSQPRQRRKEHPCLDEGGPRRRPGCRHHQHLGLRDDGQGLRPHVRAATRWQRTRRRSRL